MFQISVLSKTVMVFLVILIEISTVHAQSKDAKDGADGKYVDYTLQHDGLKREYTIRTPTKFKPTEKLPVMFVLHGGGKDDGRATAKRFNFENLADINRFIVVYPSGIQAQWNDGRGRTFRRGRNSDVDDVSYLSTLIDLVISRWHADASRIYFTGASNGGMMTHRIGIELTHKVAAIAPYYFNSRNQVKGRKFYYHTI
ncbi:MAG: PHB depolymerase family esterase, partial [Planctomycetota bacterium]